MTQDVHVPGCDDVREDIEAWAIGALDNDEAQAVEAHLASCSDCEALADVAREDAGMLALAVPLERAPAGLKARTLAAAQVLEFPARSGQRWWQAAAAVLVLGGAGLLGWSAYLQSEVNGLEGRNASIASAATAQGSDVATMRTELVQASARSEQLTDSHDAVVQIVAQPDVVRAPMEGTASAPRATGRYVWSPAERLGALVVSELPQLDDDETYRMWVVHEDEWVAAGSFEVDEEGRGRLVVRNLDSESTSDIIGFAISVEPQTGSDARTGDVVLRTEW
jgi:hypothetical protein